MPAQTLNRLEELGDRAVWVRGNTDRWLAEAFNGTFQPSGLATNPPAAYFGWCAARIGQAHRDRLANLPLTVTLDVDGLGPVTFRDATARDDNAFITVDSPISHYRAAFAGIPRRPWSSGIPTCPSTGSPTPGASSTQARSACPTGIPAQPGPAGAGRGPAAHRL